MISSSSVPHVKPTYSSRNVSFEAENILLAERRGVIQDVKEDEVAHSIKAKVHRSKKQIPACGRNLELACSENRTPAILLGDVVIL